MYACSRVKTVSGTNVVSSIKLSIHVHNSAWYPTRGVITDRRLQCYHSRECSKLYYYEIHVISFTRNDTTEEKTNGLTLPCSAFAVTTAANTTVKTGGAFRARVTVISVHILAGVSSSDFFRTVELSSIKKKKKKRKKTNGYVVRISTFTVADESKLEPLVYRASRANWLIYVPGSWPMQILRLFRHCELTSIRGGPARSTSSRPLNTFRSVRDTSRAIVVHSYGESFVFPSQWKRTTDLCPHDVLDVVFPVDALPGRDALFRVCPRGRSRGLPYWTRCNNNNNKSGRRSRKKNTHRL